MKNPQMAGFLIQNDPKMKKAFEVLSSPDAGSPDLEALKKMFAGQNFKSEQPKSEPAPRQEEKKP